MKKLEAIYNAGRWMVYCPKHGNQGAVLALDYHATDPSQSRLWTKGNEYICPICYPGIVAEFMTIKNGRIEKVADKSARATARLLAREADEIYEVVFPSERQEIEFVLSERPVLQRNWDGRHETVEFLEVENQLLRNMKRGVHGI